MRKQDKILKEALIENNVLNIEETEKYLSAAQNVNQSLKEYLLKNAIVTYKQILIALSQNQNLDIIDLHNVSIEQSVINRVPVKFVWYYKFLPVRFAENILTIAAAFPMDVKTQDEIRMHLGVEIRVVLAEEKSLIECLKRYYGLASDTIDIIMVKETKKLSFVASEEIDEVEDLEKETQDPTIANLVNEIILEAYKKRATDIHIEPYRDKVRFRYRIDGVLVDANLPQEVKHFIAPILSRIKIMANLTITEKRMPQDGSAVVKTKEQDLDLRISTMPTPRGESMVIRILPTKVMLLSLENLGFDKASVELFRRLIQKPHGIIFITGPTGSGKTTTLYACLHEINTPKRKIITIEDPVEYEMEGITQIQVNPRIKFDFSTGLRSLLRHDPDIIMVGEVRDVETAELAIRTALTGHLVFSTLHTNDSASGITRLIDMGVEPYLVASSVETFVAQRLVRIICPKCKEELKTAAGSIKEDIRKSLKLSSDEKMTLYHGKGCDYCNNTGYYGRMAIYEILVMNDTIRSAILTKPRSDYIKSLAVKSGLVTLRQNGFRAVLNGLTTTEEVLNVTVADEDFRTQEQDTKLKLIESKDTIVQANEFRFIKNKVPGSWTNASQYELRSYPRADNPVEIRYSLVSRDPNNPNSLITDGIEYKELTKNISAAGLCFVTKNFIPVDTILELKIQLGEGFKSFECLAKVCRVEENSFSNLYTIVSYYLDISSADKVSINNFVEKKLKETPIVGTQPKIN